MKAFVALILLVGSTQASAALPASLECTAGKISQDSYINLKIKDGEVAYQRHESHITIKASDTTASGSTIAVVDKTIQVQAEGDTFPVQVSALFVYNKEDHAVRATVLYDNRIQYVEAELLKCK